MWQKILHSTAYGPALNSQDLFKATAIFLMIIDHLGFFFLPEESWLRVIGRLSVPIWFFFVGYSRSQKIDPLVVVGAVILVCASALLNAPVFPMNILVTILVYRLLIRRWIAAYLEKGADGIRLFILLAVVMVWHPLAIIGWQYGMVAIVFSIYGQMLRRNIKGLPMMLWEAAAIGLFVMLQTLSFGFSDVQQWVLVGGLTGVMVLLYFYPLQYFAVPFSLLGRVSSGVVMLLARNSLVIYVLHWLLFLVLHHQLHPEQYEHFTWVKWR